MAVPIGKKPCEAAQIVNVEADIKIAVATAVFIIQKSGTTTGTDPHPVKFVEPFT